MPSIKKLYHDDQKRTQVLKRMSKLRQNSKQQRENEAKSRAFLQKLKDQSYGINEKALEITQSSLGKN